MNRYLFLILLLISYVQVVHCLQLKNKALFNVNNFFKGNGAKKNPIDLKQSIISLSRNTNNGVKATVEVKESIQDLVRQLEKINPTRKMASTTKLDGLWNLVFTTNDGSSAGKLGPFVGLVEQDIIVDKAEYVNYVKLGNGAVEGALTATWDNVNDQTWRVKFQEITFKVFGIALLRKTLNGTEGIWRMSYVDHDFRILYAQGGKNTVKENIYILAKN